MKDTMNAKRQGGWQRQDKLREGEEGKAGGAEWRGAGQRGTGTQKQGVTAGIHGSWYPA